MSNNIIIDIKIKYLCVQLWKRYQKDILFTIEAYGSFIWISDKNWYK